MPLSTINPDGWRWTCNTLERTTHQAKRTYLKTHSRCLRYSDSNVPQHTVMQDPLVSPTLDEAFSAVMTSLSSCTRQCLRYYQNTNSNEHSSQDKRFCHKYLKPRYREVQRINPLERSDGLKIMVSPGTYCITAGSHGDRPQQQTHVVSVGHGQTASLDFHI